MNDITHLTRYPERGSDDRARLNELLDEVLVATISTVVDDQPWSIPTFFARDNDRILIHGSTGAGLYRHLATGAPATVTVYSLDAIVVAATAFDSSANYRSAVLRGTFDPLPREEQDAALRLLTDRLIPGRTTEVPNNTPKELAATTALALTIQPDNWIYKTRAASAAGHDAGPDDVWIGLVPMTLTAGEPQPDASMTADVPVPPSVQALVKRHR